MQVVCLNADCAALYAAQVRARKAKRAMVDEMRATKAKLRALKPLRWHLARTQEACNAYVRLRDAGKPCICCGAPTVGELAEAGHYISRGAAPELRFDLDNINLQLQGCNRGRTVPPRARFQAHMLERIGPERLAALEGPHHPRKWTREELTELRAEFVKMAKEIET
jgi:hypothetical protein